MHDLVQKLRSTADGDCREVARDMCFQPQDGLEWADLMDRAADEIERLRDENEWLKAQLPRTPEAAATGGGFDPYNP
jgi:hypothetical protein